MLISFFSVSIGMILGRLSGFFREIFVATNFGAGFDSDFIIILLTAPDFFVNLLVGGALSMALIPEFKSLTEEQSKKLYCQALVLSGLVFSAVVLFLSLFSKFVLKALAPGLIGLISESNVNLFSLSLVSIPFTVFAGITTAYLHSKDKFLVASLGTLIFNVIIITSLQVSLSFYTDEVFSVLAISIVLAALARFYIFKRSVKEVFSFEYSFCFIQMPLIKRYFQCVLMGGLFFALPVILRSFSSSYGESEISYVNFSTKIVEFPLGVLITVFSIIFFPILSKLYSERRYEAYSVYSTKIFFTVIFLSVVACTPLYFNSSYYIELVFGYSDKFSHGDMEVMSNYLRIYALTIPFQGVNSLLIASLSAQKKTIYPLISSLSCMLFFLLASFFIANSVVDVFSCLLVSLAFSSVVLICFCLKSKALVFTFSDFIGFSPLLIIAILYGVATQLKFGGAFIILYDATGFLFCFLASLYSIRYLGR